mgnify:CR=1 FL=1
MEPDIIIAATQVNEARKVLDTTIEKSAGLLR